jgi:hypothetical protein
MIVVGENPLLTEQTGCSASGDKKLEFLVVSDISLRRTVNIRCYPAGSVLCRKRWDRNKYWATCPAIESGSSSTRPCKTWLEDFYWYCLPYGVYKTVSVSKPLWYLHGDNPGLQAVSGNDLWTGQQPRWYLLAMSVLRSPRYNALVLWQIFSSWWERCILPCWVEHPFTHPWSSLSLSPHIRKDHLALAFWNYDPEMQKPLWWSPCSLYWSAPFRCGTCRDKRRRYGICTLSQRNGIMYRTSCPRNSRRDDLDAVSLWCLSLRLIGVL